MEEIGALLTLKFELTLIAVFVFFSASTVTAETVCVPFAK